MRSHHKLVLLLLAILKEGILTEASMAQRRDSEKLVPSLKNGIKVNKVNWSPYGGHDSGANETDPRTSNVRVQNANCFKSDTYNS